MILNSRGQVGEQLGVISESAHLFSLPLVVLSILFIQLFHYSRNCKNAYHLFPKNLNVFLGLCVMIMIFL